MATLTKGGKPVAIHRRIIHENALGCGIHLFGCYSITRHGQTIKHHQSIDVTTGEVVCSCEHFSFRFAMHQPTLAQTDRHCKHVRRAVNWLQRHDLLPDAGKLVTRRCVHCGMPDADHELCDDAGKPVAGHICSDCARIVRMLGKPNNPPDEPEPEYSPDAVPDYAPDPVPEYEPEYEPAGGEDFDVRR